MALLAVGQLHVQFFKTRLRGDAALLKVAQLRLDLGQIGANLLAARPGLLGQLRQAQGLNLQLVRAALGLAGLAARGHQALRRVGVQALGTHQRRARLLSDQCLGTQFLLQVFDLLRPGQQAGLLGVLRIKTHAVRAHGMAGCHIDGLARLQLRAAVQRIVQRLRGVAALQPVHQHGVQPGVVHAQQI